VEAEVGIGSAGSNSKSCKERRANGDAGNAPVVPVLLTQTPDSAATAAVKDATVSQDTPGKDGSKLNISSNNRTFIDQPS